MELQISLFYFAKGARILGVWEVLLGVHRIISVMFGALGKFLRFFIFGLGRWVYLVEIINRILNKELQYT